MKYRSFPPAMLGLLLLATTPIAIACSSSSDAGGNSSGANTSGGSTAAGAPSAGAPAGGAGTSGAGAPAGGSDSGGTSSGGSAGSAGNTGGGGVSGSGGGANTSFILTSPDQVDNAKFGSAFTCAAMNGTFGAGVNPELDWSGAPSNTQSFAITFIDTKIGEANAMAQHWAAWDIPSAAMQLPQGTTALNGDLIGGKQSNKYLAPCPSGDDTYEFTVYALSTATLSVTGADGSGTVNSAGVAKVLAALHALTPLGTAKLHGTSGAMGK